jgi:hypothetical protein
MRLQREGENDEQTPGDIYLKGITEAIAEGREFDPLVITRAMPQARESRQPLLRSIAMANLLETRPRLPTRTTPLPICPSSPPAPLPLTPIPQQDRDL